MVVVDMLDRILDSLSEALMHKMLNLHLPLLSEALKVLRSTLEVL